MKRVGIITFQESMNYGALLQAYALKSTIEDLGFSTDVINYHSKAKEEQYSKFSLHRSPIVNLNILLSLHMTKTITNKSNEFKKEKLMLSREYINRDLIKNLNCFYDKFVCGSDQIWNPKSIKNDGTFFLDFVEDYSRRISYAPSVGVSDIDNDDLEFFKSGVQGIGFLSVRERSGAELIKKYVGKDPLLVLDPTLLVNSERWNSLTGGRKRNKGYIFLYMVGYTPRAVSLVKALAKSKGLDVVTPAKTIRDYKDGFKTFVGGPMEFLNEIKYADYVVTTSFHGLMFSIIFQKKFLTVEKPVSKNQTASRIDDFLNMVGLNGRKYSGDLNQIDENIDYDSVYCILEKKKKESIDFLNESLNR